MTELIDADDPSRAEIAAQGGHARAAKSTAEERSAIAKDAAIKRWAKSTAEERSAIAIKRWAKRPRKGGTSTGDGTGVIGLDPDPLLIALLGKVPLPEKGWPGPARVRWFRTFAMNVSQIYDGDGDPVEMKIELEKEGDPPKHMTVGWEAS